MSVDNKIFKNDKVKDGGFKGGMGWNLFDFMIKHID